MHAALATPVPVRASTVKFARPALRDVSRQPTSCLGCSLRKICMPVEIDDPDAKAIFEQLVTTRVRLRKGDVLFRAGDRFTALYAIRLGSLKTVTLADEGTEQVAGYHLPGEIVGVEGMGNDAYACQAVALEDSEVCMLPSERVERLAREDQAFQRRLYRLLSVAITRERTTSLMLGTMRAEQRLASFLLDLSNRYQLLGYSSTEFVLRMTREEIGSHLGLKLETVSRLFSRFGEEGLIRVQGKVITLLDRIGLQQLLAGE
ncbi:MAG TPA: helix-turn-helix domain-containing protein [Rhodanobacteraceae bacterium]